MYFEWRQVPDPPYLAQNFFSLSLVPVGADIFDKNSFFLLDVLYPFSILLLTDRWLRRQHLNTYLGKPEQMKT